MFYLFYLDPLFAFIVLHQQTERHAINNLENSIWPAVLPDDVAAQVGVGRGATVSGRFMEAGDVHGPYRSGRPAGP